MDTIPSVRDINRDSLQAERGNVTLNAIIGFWDFYGKPHISRRIVFRC
jgi:hypothetical protein